MGRASRTHAPEDASGMNCRPIGGAVAAARARAKRRLLVKRVDSSGYDASSNVTQTNDDGSVSIELHHPDDEQVVGSSLYGVIRTTEGEFDIRVESPSSKHEDQGAAAGATQVHPPAETCCSTSSCPTIARKCWGDNVSEDCYTRVSQPNDLGVGIQPHPSTTEPAATSSRMVCGQSYACSRNS